MASAVSRRSVLGGSAAAALGLAVLGTPAARAEEQAGTGGYQPGILEEAPLHAAFIGWDVNWAPGDKKPQLQALLSMITDDARRLMSGRGVLADTEAQMAAEPAGLTLTVAVGQRLLDAVGVAKNAVGVMPKFAGDKLRKQYAQSDLLIQFCGQDPTVLAHAVRAVGKNLRGLCTRVFTQNGFIQPSAGSFRNLFGQLDWINNPKDQTRELAVFGSAENPSWIPGGTTLALRRFEMKLDAWDEVSTAGRDYALGRRQSDGSPLSGSVGDPVDIHALDELGLPKIAANAHVALARPASGDEVIHRRGYNFVDGDASGLIFASYQRDARTSFIPVQHRLAAADAMNRWLTPVGSALYAVLPGAEKYLGEQLLGSL